MSFALAGFPLAIMSAIAVDIPSRFVTIPYRAMIDVMTALLIACAMFAGWARYRGLLLVIFIAFWAIYSLRLIYDCFLNVQSNLFLPPWEYMQLAFGVSLFPALFFFLQPDTKGIRGAFHLSALFLGLFGLLTLAFYGRLFGTEFFRMSGELQVGNYRGLNPLALSAPATLLAVYAVLQLDDQQRALKWRIGLLVLGVGLSLPGIFLGSSRSSIVTAVFCIALVMLARIRRHPKTVVGIALVIIILTPVIVILAEDAGSGLIRRFAGISLTYSTGDSSNERLLLWALTIRDFTESPFWGVGLIPRTANFAHNIVIDAFHATGLLGGIIFLIFLFGSGYRSWQLLRDHRDYSWIGLSYFYYVSESMYHGNLYLNTGFWYFSAAVLGCYSAATSQRRSPAPETVRASPNFKPLVLSK